MHGVLFGPEFGRSVSIGDKNVRYYAEGSEGGRSKVCVFWQESAHAHLTQD